MGGKDRSFTMSPVMALLIRVQSAHVLACRCCLGIKHSLSRSEEHFLQLHISQFNQLLESDCRASCGAWMEKASRAPLAPIPMSLKEKITKDFVLSCPLYQGLAGSQRTVFLHAVDIAVTPRATARARVSRVAQSSPVFQLRKKKAGKEK